jgi:LacI family transcriptional regulator
VSPSRFDDSSLSRTVWPPLTTIHQPIYDLSYSAADLLLKMLLNGATPKPVRLAHRLIRRASTGTAKTP